MYRNILVPTDGSEHAERGVEHALDLAKEHGAQLHVLFVVDENVYGATPAISSYELALEQVAEEAEDIAEEIVEDATERGIDSTMAIRRGTPEEEILKYVDEVGVDVVVMGKRGAGGVDRPNLGSVTDRVVRHAEVPVVPV